MLKLDSKLSWNNAREMVHRQRPLSGREAVARTAGKRKVGPLPRMSLMGRSRQHAGEAGADHHPDAWQYVAVNSRSKNLDQTLANVFTGQQTDERGRHVFQPINDVLTHLNLAACDPALKIHERLVAFSIEVRYDEAAQR